MLYSFLMQANWIQSNKSDSQPQYLILYFTLAVFLECYIRKKYASIDFYHTECLDYIYIPSALLNGKGSL